MIFTAVIRGLALLSAALSRDPHCSFFFVFFCIIFIIRCTSLSARGRAGQPVGSCHTKHLTDSIKYWKKKKKIDRSPSPIQNPEDEAWGILLLLIHDPKRCVIFFFCRIDYYISCNTGFYIKDPLLRCSALKI